MSSSLDAFHFLRPQWLWLLVPAALVVWLLGRRSDPLRPWRGLVAPHLLPHLLVGHDRGFRVHPRHLVAVALGLSCLALAGPTFRREPPPFSQDKASLVIAIDLDRTMDAIDVAPTRLERAKQKVRDLLKQRSGARTALVAYAGSAHMVVPLTDDAAILETYLEALATPLMPVRGRDAASALRLAESLLAKEPVPGTILFITDGIPKEQAGAFGAVHAKSPTQIAVLAVGTSEGGPVREGAGFLTEGGRRVVARLDRDGLLAVSREADALVASATLDDADVARIQRGIQSHMQAAIEEDQKARYKDFGWYLTPALALLAGFWFRRGWTIRWATVLLLAVLPSPVHAGDWRFADLWATPDQQGRYYFDRGDYKTAAERFTDPMWKGVACYRAADHACAIDAFARVDSPEAWYDLGNAYARTGQLKLAIAAYDKALAGRPGWPEATKNRGLVAALIPAEKKDDDEEGQEPAEKPDKIEFDDKGKKGKLGKVETKALTDEQIEKMWLRGVQTSPAEFLRLKFAAQDEDARKAKAAAGAKK